MTNKTEKTIIDPVVLSKDTTCWFPTPDGFEIKLKFLGRKDLAEL